MENRASVLKKCSLFEGIAENKIEDMLVCLGAVTMKYGKGETVFHEGDPALYLGIVLSGSVMVIHEDYYGNRSIVAHIVPGEVFGESFACAAIDSLPVSVVAKQDCSCLLIDCSRITKSCTNACSFHSQIIFNLLKLVAQKNLLFHQKLDIISKRTTREKLMTYLTAQAKMWGKDEFTIPYDRQALADYLEVDRSGLSSEIGRLRREGKIICEKNHFKLLKN